jgi:hypothetical protein
MSANQHQLEEISFDFKSHAQLSPAVELRRGSFVCHLMLRKKQLVQTKVKTK